jgi:hypothetical protein
MKIRPVGAELFHADGRTDMTNLKVAFRNSAEVPEDILLNSDGLNNDYKNTLKHYN